MEIPLCVFFSNSVRLSVYFLKQVLGGDSFCTFPIIFKQISHMLNFEKTNSLTLYYTLHMIDCLAQTRMCETAL